MLFDPDRHEPVCDKPWDAGRALATVSAIARGNEQCCDSEWRWPLHPLDDEGDEPPTGFKNLYLGRAGVPRGARHRHRAV